MNNKNKKIVLLYPPTGSFTDYNTPTGTLYVATYLKQHGYDVTFIDCSVEENYMERVREAVKDALCIGSYCMSVHIKHLIPLLEEVKRINPAIKTVLGGAHPTLFPEQTVTDPLVDFVVIGEGEATMLELVQTLEKSEEPFAPIETDFSKIKGIAFKNWAGIPIITGQREFMDMDTLPFVDWNLMSEKALESMKTKIGRVQTSRGCPFHCKFCINVVSKNGKMRYRSPKLVVDEIEHLVKTYGVHRIGIRDEVFLLNRQNAKEIAQGIIDRGIKITWLANPHVKFLRESWVDDEYLDLLKRSGCTKLQCGGESGSQRILDMLNKTITPEDILNYVKRAKKHGIISLVAFMTGLPSETRKEQLETLKLIWEILDAAPETFINGAALYRPYPGGELFNQCVKEYGLKMPESFRGWADIETIGGTKPPWVDRLWFDQNLWTHVTFARASKVGYLSEMCKKILEKYGLHYAIAAYFYGKLSHARLKYNLYSLPFEFYALHLLWKWRGEIPELS